MLAVLLLQATAPAEPPPPARIDILVAQPKRRCEPGEGDEIVVCGQRDDPELYRLRPLDPRFEAERGLPKAEIGVFGNAKVAAETEQLMVAGAPSNRVMFRLKLPF